MDRLTHAPLRNVLLHTGVRVPLAEFYAAKPLVLVFLRHLGCIFCKEQVASLRSLTELNLVFVCMAQPEETSTFRETLDSPQTYICDPEGDLYRDFGVREGRLAQLLGPRVIARGVQATLHGFSNRRPTANARMLGAAFVVNLAGDIVWSRISKDAADIVSPEALVHAAASL